VVFVEWQSQATERGLDIRELNYVFRFEISNSDTIEVIQRLFGGMYRQWPGLDFQMTHETGLAMLGTPNGRGVAWLLATHKEQFGKRTIESVTVWSDPQDPEDPPDLDPNYYAYFKIVPLGG
jgi:hypothetical protein